MRKNSDRYHWFREMPETLRLCLYSNLIVFPGVVVLLTYGIFGILLNIPLTYLVVDTVTFFGIRAQECRRIERRRREEEAEHSEEVRQRIYQKIEELREMEI